MKVRLGLVSNSSGASFLVSCHNSLEGKEKLELIAKLLTLGFGETMAYYPDQISILDEGDLPEKYRDNVWFKTNYGLILSINEFDTHVELIKHKIKYVATCHYDQYVVEYNGKNTVTIATNYGTLMLMGHSEEEFNKYHKEPIKKVRCKKFLEDGY